MTDEPKRVVAAVCRICGRHLTLEEFRACRGMGHYCTSHHSLGTVKAENLRPSGPARRRSSKSAGRTVDGRPPADRSARPSGYPCKAQFAKTAAIRRGRLTTEHASCVDGQAVFVSNEVGYGPAEIAMLFITHPEGRALAQSSGYECHA